HEIRAAARAAGDLLRAKGLHPFAMTTGSRGIHVLVPLRRTAGYDRVRADARTLADELVDEHPNKLTREHRAEHRRHRRYGVLQHGWPQHWYAWRHVIPELARTRRVIAPDLRGMGWSEAPPGRYEKETFAGDLVALLDALELEQVDLVGHDWGAFAGFLACLHAPGRFRRFLALGITQPRPTPDPV